MSPSGSGLSMLQFKGSADSENYAKRKEVIVSAVLMVTINIYTARRVVPS